MAGGSREHSEQDRREGMPEKIKAYMVIDAEGVPVKAWDSGLRIKTKRDDAVRTVKYLDGLERTWLPDYKSGPHQVIEVTITPKPRNYVGAVWPQRRKGLRRRGTPQAAPTK